MQKPPFKLANVAGRAAVGADLGSYRVRLAGGFAGAGDSRDLRAAPADAAAAPPTRGPTRARLGELDNHLHCSVIGTCLSTTELRRILAGLIDCVAASDLELHHEAVRLAGQGGPPARALHKALDDVHAGTLARFAEARDGAAVLSLWEAALALGEVPGAYWAVLSHRHANGAIRQKAFGDVHMLSHRIGATNRAELGRLVALEHENRELGTRLRRQQTRSKELVAERDQVIEGLRAELTQAQAELARSDRQALVAAGSAASGAGKADPMALHSARRERAERALERAASEASDLRDELAKARTIIKALGEELAAAEGQLRTLAGGEPAQSGALERAIRGRCILYVGGRPSTSAAIRDLVVRSGGEFRHHDGGLEDRKGLLSSAAATADLVVIPIDCIDHDSATNLKRLCARQGVAFVPVRTASIASFAAALSALATQNDHPAAPERAVCLKHG